MISAIVYSVVSGLIFSGLLAGLIFVGVKLLSKKQSSGASDQIREIDKTISSLTESINLAVKDFDPLVSLDRLEEIELNRMTLLDSLRSIQSKLASLDKALATKQVEVDKAEAGHNDLKRSKEAAAVLADELRQAKERLEAEYKALEGELNQSLSQLEILSKELKLNPQAEVGMNKIHNALVNSKTQLKTLTLLYQQGSTRFVNLQTQYRDLEKEFTKLVEKELSG